LIVLVIVILSLIFVADGTVRDPRCNKYKTKNYCNRTLEWEQKLKTATLPPCGNNTINNTENALVILLIGDYGLAEAICESQVVDLMKKIQQQWDVDFMLTMGDNNYYTGICDELETNIGQYFDSWYPYGKSCRNPGVGNSTDFKKSRETTIRFFPSLGNHDWDTYSKYGVKNLPYIQYFQYVTSFEPQWPGGQFYTVDPVTVINRKDQLKGLFQIFSLNSNLGSKLEFKDDYQKQKDWIQRALNESTATWKIVYFHHSPYTTAEHDPPATWMMWPFGDWGASAVLTGHEHTYERVMRDIPYVVNGLGGHPYLYELSGPECPPVKGSVVRYNDAHGIALAVVTQDEFRMCMYSTENGITKVDEFAFN